MISKKNKLIVISGATATGKTELSVILAKKINGEIVSADSMQVYRYMNIGTAKPSQSEMGGIRHYLIDELYPDEEFSVSAFQKLAEECIFEIYSRGRIPILVGGTGFYINSVIYGNEFVETNADRGFREEMYRLAADIGNEGLHEQLKMIDPKSAESIHHNNVKRVIRALEYHKLTGERISEHNERERLRKPKYEATQVILGMDRERLYARINSRVDSMVSNGLFDEVEWLLRHGYHENLVSMQGIGYKESVKYIKKLCSKEAAIDEIKKATRHFAKRQVTWFSNQTKEPYYIDVGEKLDKNAIYDEVMRTVEQ